MKKTWLKATQNDIKNLIKNQTLLVEDPKKGEHVTPCMDMYKASIQYNGSHDKLKMDFVVRGYFQNNEVVGDTWSLTSYMRTLKYSLEDTTKEKARFCQLYFIVAFLQKKKTEYL